MAKKAKNKHGSWENIMSNLLKRMERAKRKNKSENYIKDLEKAIAKHH